jgi:hypothetical protein
MSIWVFGVVLYSSSLFASESFDVLPRIQYMRWEVNPGSFVLVKISVFLVSLRSRLMPRYLTVLYWGIVFPVSE